jgi:hypothetical protein
MREPHQSESRDEDTDCRQGRSAPTADEIPNERGRGKDRAGGELTDGNRIEELPLAQPTQVLDEILLQERDQDVSRPVQRGSDLQELEKQPHGRIGLSYRG